MPIRLATDADGAAIGRLFAEAGVSDYGGVDWSEVAGSWLVADGTGRLDGAIQVALTKPFGWIGFVVVHPEAQGRNADGAGGLRKIVGQVAYDLYAAAVMVMRRAGVSLVLGTVEMGPELAPLRAVLESWGAQTVGQAWLLAMRVKETS